MQCPSCHAQIPEGLAFCPSCGAPVAPAQPPQPVAPTTQMPPVGQPTTQMPPAQPYVPPGAPYGAPPAPAPPASGKGSKVLVIVLVIVALLLCCCITVAGGGWYYYSQQQKKAAGTQPGATDPSGTDETEGEDPAAEGAFATAEEAVESALPEEDWVYKLDSDDDDSRVYIAGPPQSEYAMRIEVVKTGGGWAVKMTDALPPVGEQGGDTGTEAQEAQEVVRRFLDFIKADKPLKAQALCVEPFSTDSASAAYSNGEFTAYTIHGASANPDGTFYVSVTEVWYGQAQESSYLVVPTEAGYRISELLVE